MRRIRTTLLAAATAAAVAASTAACASSGGSSSGGGSGPITLGATLSLTGSLSAFGALQKQGYQEAIDWVNAAGGLKVGSSKRKVALKVLDNRSDTNQASSQARELILKDDVTALLGPCTTPYVIPVAQVAESERVPLVTSCAPELGFEQGSTSGWKYSWDLFFNEKEQAAGAVKSVTNGVPSNKKVALFTDTEPDGVAERPLYKAAAAAAGLDVVGDYTFPPGTSDFSSFINDAKAKGAQLVIGQMVPPDGIALWKQMKALQLKPQAAWVAKASATKGWVDALGPVSDGTLCETFWSPSIGDPATSKHIESTLGKTIPDTPDLGFAVFSLTAAQVLMDAIGKAGSTDPGAINKAIGQTDKEYALGTIKFTKNFSVTPNIDAQWQGSNTIDLSPTPTGTLQVPPRGLS